ncbi:OmpH family outer membrane protein [Novosphingobium sp. Gsoil 351]|uniref:OmpH family outer membrane protein n=1 Tax=Novosphingobium sp. Gsoil 351 TaxID=2675225 RepID=UPI0012B4A8BE|nr:OmpH family outer membrane protein [Novosphingobium sp. Gsoil 351]QGN56026.1 OmpH family outer membrane protein [Novosphingobium sp. Gsoil 351]
MKIMSKSLVAASLLLAGSQFAFVVPAAAQAVKGIAVANPTAIVALSNAFKVAETQRPVTYKAQIDQANARKAQIEAQLRPMAAKLQTDAQAPNAASNQAALQQQYAQIQQIEQSGQNEINQILQPVALSRAYVIEQIGDKLEQATKQAMAKQKIEILLDSQSVINAGETYNLNQAILNEVNAILPSAQLVPPAGWLPRQQREAQAQQQGAAPAPAAAAPATPSTKPKGR